MCPRVLLSPCILLAYKLSFYNSTRVLPAAPSPAPAADSSSSASGAAAGNGAIRRLLWRDGILLAAAAAVSSYFASMGGRDASASVGRRDADFGCKCSGLSNSASARIEHAAAALASKASLR